MRRYKLCGSAPIDRASADLLSNEGGSYGR
jgi:hypothetical protein